MGEIKVSGYDLFPVGIGIYTMPDGFSDEEVVAFNHYEKKTLVNLDQLKTTDTYILENPLLSKTKSFIDTCLSKYMNDFMNSPTECRITQSWMNFYKKGTSHHRHAHANSYLSGTLYVEAGGDDCLHFSNPHAFTIMPPISEYNIYNSNFWFVPVKSFELFVFPSWIEHSVEKVNTDRRVTISFNSFPVGDLGSERSLNLLNIK